MKILKFCKFCKKEIFEGDYCSDLCSKKYGINIVNSQIAEDIRLYRDRINARINLIAKEQEKLSSEMEYLYKASSDISAILNKSDSL